VVNWDDRQERAFREVKRVLSNEPIYKLPDLNRCIKPKFGWMLVTGTWCLLCQQKADSERA